MNSFKLYIYHMLTVFMPATRFFAAKRMLLRWAGASVGSNVRIVSSARFHLTGNLHIGDDTFIGHEVMIAGGSATVRIGRAVDIAPRVSLITGSHQPFTVPGKAAGEGYSMPIHIDNGSWVGAAATILGGVTVGEQAIVAAGTLVRSDIPQFQVHAGVPNRQIGAGDAPC